MRPGVDGGGSFTGGDGAALAVGTVDVDTAGVGAPPSVAEQAGYRWVRAPPRAGQSGSHPQTTVPAQPATTPSWSPGTRCCRRTSSTVVAGAHATSCTKRSCSGSSTHLQPPPTPARSRQAHTRRVRARCHRPDRRHCDRITTHPLSTQPAADPHAHELVSSQKEISGLVHRLVALSAIADE